MVDTEKPIKNTTVECETCLKEIPVSGAKSVEISDYVHYCCGLECYTQWQKQEKKRSNKLYLNPVSTRSD